MVTMMVKVVFARWWWHQLSTDGSLIVQEMVWNIMHGVDLEAAKATSLEKRVGHSKNCTKLFIFFFTSGSLLGVVRAVGRPISSWHGYPRLLEKWLHGHKIPVRVCQKSSFGFSLWNPGFRLLVSQLNHWWWWRSRRARESSRPTCPLKCSHARCQIISLLISIHMILRLWKSKQRWSMWQGILGMPLSPISTIGECVLLLPKTTNFDPSLKKATFEMKLDG